MSACPAFSAQYADGIADTLRSIDCMSGAATHAAFDRLFGVDGELMTALTALLTLFIGWMAVNLLTGRSRLTLAGMTPRMAVLGLVLTFATSWVAYQSVVWNLATGAPDQIASLLVGSHGSATMIFADKLDTLFAAIADAASAVPAPDGDKAGVASPADLLWISALLLLLGTAGVLLVSRIALAALLALGPVFILFALFRGTRGLFEGWVRCVALFALTPLFAVLIGGAALGFLAPVVAALGQGGELTMRAAITVFLAASVYLALMLITLKVTTTLTSSWRLPTMLAEAPSTPPAPCAPLVSSPVLLAQGGAQHDVERGERVRTMLAMLGAADPPASQAIAIERTTSLPSSITPIPQAAAQGDDRARGLGSRYRTPPPALPREIPS